MRWHKLSTAVGLSLRLGAGEKPSRSSWVPLGGPSKQSLFRTSQRTELRSSASASRAKCSLTPPTLHLQVEASCFCLGQPNFYPARSTKAVSGDCFPTIWYRKARISPSFSIFPAVLDHEHLACMSAWPSTKRHPRAGHSNSSTPTCYQKHCGEFFVLHFWGRKHLIFPSFQWRSLASTTPRHICTGQPCSSFWLRKNWLLKEIKKILVKILDWECSSPLRELIQYYFPAKGLVLPYLGISESATGLLRQAQKQRRSLCGSPTPQLSCSLPNQGFQNQNESCISVCDTYLRRASHIATVRFSQDTEILSQKGVRNRKTLDKEGYIFPYTTL